jgi:hypothetical protein
MNSLPRYTKFTGNAGIFLECAFVKEKATGKMVPEYEDSTARIRTEGPVERIKLLVSKLPDRPVKEVSFKFGSKLNPEEVSDAILKQFGVRIHSYHGEQVSVNLGDNITLLLWEGDNWAPVIMPGGYTVALLSEKVKAAEKRLLKKHDEIFQGRSFKRVQTSQHTLSPNESN